MSSQSAPAVTSRLSVMMFLQFFVWGTWFSTLAQCLSTNGLGDFGAGAYSTVPIAAMIAPLFLGLIADRFFPSQIVMGILFLIGGVLMLIVPGVAASGNGKLMVWLMLGHMLCYMPTLGLGNTVAFSHLDRISFPKVRVWGTIGWIVAGLVIGFMGWSSSLNMFWVTAGSSLLLGAFCFVLPHTPAPAREQPLNWRTLLMFDALRLFRKPAFAVFLVCSCLICVPLAYYFGLTARYLSNTGFDQPASSMTIGQMSEIFFMLLIPFFFRRLGVKWMVIIGMGAWVLRYMLFSWGAPEQVTWMLFLGIALHGICYDFFFVTGFMYADRVAPKEARSQTQSLLVFLTQGVGMYLGYQIAFGKFGNTVTSYDALNDAVITAKGEPELTFAQQLGRMFSVDLPQSMDSTLLAETMQQWKAFWTFPAAMAGVVLVLFFLTFWDKTRVTDQQEEEAAGVNEG